MLDECVFCKIVNGEIPCYKIWEDKEFLAFLDINPYSIGHVLVISKKHYRWIWDMNEKEYSNLMSKVYFLANILRKVFDVEWVEEVVAGVGVPHVHVHLLPRKENDGLGEVPIKPLEPKPSEQEMKKLAEKIKNAL